MKKQLRIFALVATVLLSVNGFALEINNDPTASESLDSGSSGVTLQAISHQSGHVNSMFGVAIGNGTQANPIHVGTQMGVNHKAILTFDTSSIPDNAQINYVLLLVGVEIDGYQGDYFRYIFENIAVDFSGAVGFGGSYVITGADYYAPAAASFETVIGNGAVGGLMLNLDINQNPRDLTPYINKQGKTQIRLRMFQNPTLELVDIFGMDYPDLSGINLYVGWE